MGESTAISWTDHTFNPWWGCTRVSPGCQHCYAEAFAKRTGNDVWGTSPRRFFGDKHWAEPLKWDRQAEADGRPHLVFCASMADVFEDRSELVEHRARLWDLIDRTPYLIWQLLTKRPENVLKLTPEGWHGAGFADRPERLWPPNVWIGTTVEDQQRADDRIPELLKVPAAVRFLSCEPLLGPVDVAAATIPGRNDWFNGTCGVRGYISAAGLTGADRHPDRCVCQNETTPHKHRAEPPHSCGRCLECSAYTPARPLAGIGWVIAGGESGPRHRPFDLDQARALRDQCAAAGVPFLFKQVGGFTPTAGGDLLDGEQLKAFPSEARRGARR
jgi:protein gp37